MISPEEIFLNANIDHRLCLFCHPNQGMSLYETEHFSIFRCNYPAELGHLMISSKMHYGCLGEIDTSFIPELEQIKRCMSEWYAMQNHDVLYYEHGRAGSCHSKGGSEIQCEHFHLNSIASNVCIHHQLQELYGEGIPIESLEQLPEIFDDWGEYLYFENHLGESRYYPVTNQAVAPHLLRTLITVATKKPQNADWEKHQSYPEFLENFHFTQSLPEHMKDSIYALS
ncbi:hypothetical protein N9Y92_01040 [Chlamydiales bacterium]|nr:hypothetical protein [Chlamydiales bacterium]